MKIAHTCLLLIYAAGLAVAQILYKTAVFNVKNHMDNFSIFLFIFGLMHELFFWLAIILLGVLMIAWAWLLTFIPLHFAYPFVVVAVIFLGIFEHFSAGAALNYKYFIGAAMIAAGLYFMSMQNVK
jgi:hypothetical protein